MTTYPPCPTAFQWTPDYSVGCEVTGQVSTRPSWRSAHALGRLHCKRRDPDGDLAFESTLDALMAQARAHFAAEQALCSSNVSLPPVWTSSKTSSDEFDFLAHEIITRDELRADRTAAFSVACGGPGTSWAPAKRTGSFLSEKLPQRLSAAKLGACTQAPLCRTSSASKPARPATASTWACKAGRLARRVYLGGAGRVAAGPPGSTSKASAAPAPEP
jgi:hypothetical protein